jgi:hypothetical protein
MNLTYPAYSSSVSICIASFMIWISTFRVVQEVKKTDKNNTTGQAGKENGKGKENIQWELKSFLKNYLEGAQVLMEMMSNCFAWNVEGILFLKPGNRNFLKCGV